MSFFEDASLVLIPSAQKTSKVYSVKPTDGTGDLTFTRSNDTATRVGPDGLIEKVRTNLILQSNTFSNAAWSKVGGTLTAGQSDPNGGTNAFKVELASGGNSYLYQSIASIPAGEKTVSCWMRADSAITISFGSGGATPNEVTLTTSWVRYSFTTTDTTGGVFFGNYFPVIGNPALTFYVFQSQYEMGVMTDYIATTSAAVSVGPVANVPRLDYLNSSCPRLLLEPQRTNLLTYSEQQDNAAWTKAGATITANATTSPDGYTNADKVVETTSTGTHGTYASAGISNATAYTWSGFFKAAERTKIRLLAQTGGTPYANFNLSNGTVEFADAGITASVQSYGNGWYRCIATATSSATTAYFNWSMLDASGNEVYTGNGTSGLFAWGCSIEAGAYATSYIPTLGAAVTRGADSASKTSASALIGQTEGTLYCDVEWTLKPESGSPIISLVALNNTTNLQNCIVLGIERQSGGTNRFYSFVQVSNSTTAALIGSNITNGRYKAAFAYKENDFVLYVNGVQIATDTSGAVPTNSQVIVGGRFVGDSFQVSDPISQALVFPTRLQNSDLAALTA